MRIDRPVHCTMLCLILLVALIPAAPVFAAESAPSSGPAAHATRASLERIERWDGDLRAVIALNPSAMEQAAGGGLDSLKAAIGPLGASCGGCHKAYRQPKD